MTSGRIEDDEERWSLHKAPIVIERVKKGYKCSFSRSSIGSGQYFRDMKPGMMEFEAGRWATASTELCSSWEDNKTLLTSHGEQAPLEASAVCAVGKMV